VRWVEGPAEESYAHGLFSLEWLASGAGKTRLRRKLSERLPGNDLSVPGRCSTKTDMVYTMVEDGWLSQLDA
jgi:hypothetical protein